MITFREVTIYNVKSNRKNAKSIYKTIKVVRGEDRLKTAFTNNDYYDVMEWLFIAPYDYFNLVIYSDNICLRSWSNHLMSKSQVEKVVKEYFKLFNNELKK